jgi:hypothetical protein
MSWPQGSSAWRFWYVEEGFLSPARGYRFKRFDQSLWTDLDERDHSIAIRLGRRPDMQVLTRQVDHFLCALHSARILLDLRVHR